MAKKIAKKNQEKKKLTTKQELFIEYYLESFNASKAAEMAGYSKDTVGAIGFENLKKPEIKSEIEKRIDLLKERIPTDIIQHLKNLIFFNSSDLLDEDGNIDKKRIKENAIPGIVSGMTIHGKDGRNGYEEKISFKLTDQTKAIELMSKILKLYDDKSDVNVNNHIIYLDRQDEGL